MKFLFRWLIIMLIYAGVMYVVCPLLLPIANSFHLELTEWSSELMKNHPKSIAFFNFVSLFVLIVLENLPFIFLVLLSIGIFIGCILLVDKIFTSIGFATNSTEDDDQAN